MALRVFRSDASKVRPTPQGGIEVEAVLTKPGVFVYYNGNGQAVREYRPPEEVFRADSLATLANAPVTLRHPGLVDATNFKKFAVGHVAGAPRIEGDKVVATLWVQDAAALDAIQKGMREISCGTQWMDVDNTPGVTPDGEPYDCVLRTPRYNHVAIEPRARLGSDVRLRLDGAGNEIEEPLPMIFRVDGKDYDVSTAEGKAAYEQALARKESAAAARMDALQAELNTARTELSQATARFDSAQTPEALDKRVRERAELVALVAQVDDKFRCDGLSDAELQRKVVASVYPSLRLDGKDATYVGTLFDGAKATLAERKATAAAAVTRAAENPPTAPATRQDGAPAQRFDASQEVLDALNRSRERDKDGWRKPLAAGKA